MASTGTLKGPFKLVTVNTAPERAKRLIGRMIEALKDRYDIVHVANCTEIEEVCSTVTRLQPDVLFCASMWSPDESQRIRALAREANPAIVTYALPQGLQVERGPDAVVEHLVAHVPGLLDSVKC